MSSHPPIPHALDELHCRTMPFKVCTIVTHDPTSRDMEPQPAPGRGESTMLGARPT